MRISDWSSDVCSSDLQARVDDDALDVVLAAHGDLDQAATCSALDSDVGQGILSLFHVFLHLLGLTHQTRDLSFHHEASILKNKLESGQLYRRRADRVGYNTCIKITHQCAYDIVVTQDRKSTRLNSSH